jgi:hypothetical protein
MPRCFTKVAGTAAAKYSTQRGMAWQAVKIIFAMSVSLFWMRLLHMVRTAIALAR